MAYPIHQAMKTTKKILTLKQWIKRFDAILANTQSEFDKAYENFLYAQDGIKSGKPADFDWAGYLATAESNFNYYKQQLDLHKYWVKTAERSYPGYVRMEKEYNPR